MSCKHTHYDGTCPFCYFRVTEWINNYFPAIQTKDNTITEDDAIMIYYEAMRCQREADQRIHNHNHHTVVEPIKLGNFLKSKWNNFIDRLKV